jgi:PTS system nitrogen regulatory IIA component
MENREQSDSLMTLSDIAGYLKVAEKTVLRMIQKNEIPCVKIASQWRFDRKLIDEWIAGKMNKVEADELTLLMQEDAESVPLSRLVAEDFIITDLKPGSRKKILSELSMPLVKAGLVEDHERFVQKLIEREEMMSTCLGRGVAMPHIRNPQENMSSTPAIVVGICREGTVFDLAGDDPVRVFFLVYTNNEIAHLRIIGKINAFIRKMPDLNEFLTAETAKDVMRVLLKY